MPMSWAGTPLRKNDMRRVLAGALSAMFGNSAPAAPTLGTPVAGNGQVTIPFTDGATGGAAITSHKVYRGTAAGGETLLGTITTGSPFIDTGLTNGTAYFYKLSAVNSAGEGAQSAEVSGTPAGSSGVPTGTTTAYATLPATQAVGNSSGGSTMTARRLNRLDRLISRLQACGSWSKLVGIYVAGDTEAQSLVNIKSPGTYDLTKVGTPTFSPGNGFSTTVNTSYYDTTIPLSALGQNDHCMAIQSQTTTKSDAVDCGVADGAGGANGILMIAYNSTGTVRYRSSGAGVNATATTYFNGAGWTAINRTAAGALGISHHGVTVENDAPTSSTAPVDATKTVCILTAGGLTGSPSVRTVKGFFVGASLTQAQMAETCAALTDYGMGISYGDVMIYPAGVGPANLTVDLAIYGLTPAAICAAANAKRAGLNVALLGDWRDSSIWDIGGMVTNGLDWIDEKAPTAVTGLFRDALSYINTVVIGGADNSTQAGMSPEPRYWQYAFRRMLDPTRTSGTLIPGQDINVYMSGGIKSVTKSGGAIAYMTMNDGRVVAAKQFMECGYDGDLVYFSGAPYIVGREAAGTGVEANNGYYTTYTLPTDGTATRSVSPFDTDGTTLLPDVVATPALSAGAADPSLQAMNYRLTATSNPNRYAPFDFAAAPPNYNAKRYEVLGRVIAASTAASVSFPIAQLFTDQPTLTSGVVDRNNGGCGVSTDLAQSGLTYGQAGVNLSARAAVFNDVRDYTRGLFYWIATDSRVPASLKTAVTGYGLDPLANLDPGLYGVLFFPNLCYRREPTYQMKNTGAMGSGIAVLDGNDVNATDGNTPRSLKTVGITNYDIDIHSMRRVNNGGTLNIQGLLYTPGGGSNKLSPVPLEVCVPDAGVATNLLVATAPSMTKIAMGTYRLEPGMAQTAEALSQVAYQAIQDGTSVQNVNYSAVRSALLNNNDNTKLQIPQVA